MFEETCNQLADLSYLFAVGFAMLVAVKLFPSSSMNNYIKIGLFLLVGFGSYFLLKSIFALC